MKYVIYTAVIGLFLGVILTHIGGVPVVGPSMLFMVLVPPVMGVLLTLDDDLPGGFSNPDGISPGPWRDWRNWADLGSRAAIAGFGFAIDCGLLTVPGITLLVVGGAGVLACIRLQDRIADEEQHDV